MDTIPHVDDAIRTLTNFKKDIDSWLEFHRTHCELDWEESCAPLLEQITWSSSTIGSHVVAQCFRCNNKKVFMYDPDTY